MFRIIPVIIQEFNKAFTIQKNFENAQKKADAKRRLLKIIFTKS